MCSRVLSDWDIVVDNFHVKNQPESCHYFLTHFHSDHVAGLSAAWDKRPLHVSEATWKLMELRYGADAPVVHHATVWQTEEWHTLVLREQQVEVLCLPAFHCTGSVMWLFKFPNGANVVFTGDYRFHESTLEWPGWSDMKPVSLLFYDSSFDNPRVKIPSLRQSVQALDSVYQRLGPHQRLAILLHTGGVEQLVADFCLTHRRRWYLESSTKNHAEARVGLMELASQWRARGPEDNRAVWCVGEQFRTRHEHDDRWVFVRPSAVWFLCHQETLDNGPYQFGDAVPDTTHTFRVFYSTHSSYEENQRFIRFLQPQMTSACVANITPTHCERQGSVLPHWDYYQQLNEENTRALRAFQSERN